MSKYAWVTLATNDSYSLGALVVAHSLKRVHTVHQMAVLITPGVSEAMKTKLRAVFNVVEEVNLLDSKDEANLALLKRPELGVTFTKLHCWRLTQFEKCVFLDADTLVLRNCDELFDREELSAAPDIGWPDCFNSGVYVFKPNLETFASLLQYAVTNGSFDGGDQGLLNAYFSDWAHKDIQKHLPFIYNTSSVATYSYLPAFKQFGQNTKILHFIGAVKPWLQKFNSETRKVYVPSEYQHLANFLQYWWDIFAEDVHSRLSPDMRTEQWVDRMVQQHQENVGHWENRPRDDQREEATHHTLHSTAVDGSGGYQKTHDSNVNITATGDSNSCADGSNNQPNSALAHQHEASSPSTSCFSQQAADQPKPTEPNEGNYGGDGGGGGNIGDVSGLAGALAQVHLGEAKSQEQEAYEEHMRRQCWETGNIDYMGRDSFDNIWKRIQQTLNTGTGGTAAPPSVEEKAATPGAASQTATAQRTSRRPSRSRSGTPKRDPKDRSPTPQPEEKLSVDKKEAHVVPPPAITEEDDLAILRVSSIESSSISSTSSSSGAMRTQSKLPPPIQYDPTTNTTTLTKKVFAGYQQFITTKNREGKSHTHMKLVYDPSVEDDQTPAGEEADQPAAKGTDQPDTIVQPVRGDGPKTVEQARVVAETTAQQARTEIPARPPVEKPTTQSSSTSAYAKPAPTTQTTKPTVAAATATPQPQQQQQQQVAPESLAGKTNELSESKQPVKALRKKRHISPQAARPQQPTPNQAASTNDQAPGKTPPSPSSSSSSSSLTTSAGSARHGNQSPAANQSKTTTAISASVVVSPSSPTVPSSKTETSHTNNSNTPKATRTTAREEKKPAPTTLTQQQSPEQNRTPVKQTPRPNSAQKQDQLEDDEGVKVASSPPVPPRRKRESRTTKLGKTKKSKLVQLLLSCISCPKKKR
ncbi:serine/threonine-protein kinase par-1 isoform X5 [Anopheles stephensi]|uniref:serine/threonine-protein kinase par-1 isoform X5 n=1 Tax=Anopheles stephensi TaxID=30069 RepID=UPI001658A9FE|nr:serine/threonine-protein kinase par-1 isoform X5 [Anopheles stephensi]